MFVAPEAEGTGVARSLHHDLLDRARERGPAQLSLNTSSGTRAEQFYVRAGWERAGLTADGELRLELRLTG